MSLRKEINWIPDFFTKINANLSRILNANGCRELWLQGEIYLYLNDENLFTNATKKKFDIFKKDRLIIEIKILGGNYLTKVVNSLSKDFTKLHEHNGNEKKYVMLILDNKVQDSNLYKNLFNYKNEFAKKIYTNNFGNYYVRLWMVS